MLHENKTEIEKENNHMKLLNIISIQLGISFP